MSKPRRKTLKAACEALALVDPALARAYDEFGVPDWRYGTAEYVTLARMIAYQQITTKAAATIWKRVEAHLGEVTPEIVLAAEPEELRACGLSRSKISHLNSIAEAIVSGALNLDRVRKVPLEEAQKELIAVRGIGPWTAELFLLYSGVLDAFPPGDVGLMEAHRLLLDEENRMEIKAFTQHAEIWRPHRGVAAHMLWNWLNTRRETTFPG